MAMVKIWVHVVWATKSRVPTLQAPGRYELFTHIREHARKKGIHIDFLNGYVEHVHALVSMDAKQNIADVVQILKGESAFWANHKRFLFEQALKWCEGYYAVSVCESALDKVREYLKNQERHHDRRNFLKECAEFMQKYGFPAPLG
jgi:putative transposase